MYPSFRYHATEEPKIVNSPEEEKELGKGWEDSPAAFGIETAPGVKPDPAIAKARKATK